MNRHYLLIYSGLLLLVILLGAFLYLIRPVVVPFLLAFLLAYFLDPAADALERQGASRPLAVVIVFSAFLLAVAAAAGFLVPAIKGELLHLQRELPAYAERLFALLPPEVLQWLGVSADQDLQTLLGRLLEGVRNLSADVVNQVVLFLSRAFSSTFSFLVAVLGYFIIPIYLFYLLTDFDRITAGALRLVPPRHQEEVKSLVLEIDAVLGGFIRGQLLVCMILAVLYSLGLLIIGVDLALLIGFASGMAFIIPYLGTILGIIVAGSMAAVEFRDLLHPLMVIGWFSLVQALEGTVITPRLVGNRVGLHPLATILAVLIGGELFGFLGLLLAVPVTASGNVVLRYLLERYRSSRFYHGAALVEDEA